VGKKGEKSYKSTLREYAESICVAVILALFIRTFVVQAFKIPTSSMEPNLLVGDHLFVNKMLYAPTANPLETALMPTRDIRRHDVVVFKYPMEPETDFIKRVVALPGESVRIEDKRVYINGEDEPLDEPLAYFSQPPGTARGKPLVDSRRDNMPEIQIPAGHYFVMGDNRDNSRDSRFWGVLPRDLVKGRALVIYWSYDAPEEAYFASGLTQKIEALWNVVTNFIDGTRWDRFFHLVR
jgi:signal peptidase I